MKSFRKQLGWAGSHTHEFEMVVTKPYWPPFYSTQFFLPRIKVKLKNRAQRLSKGSVEAEIRYFDGNISEVTTVDNEWGDLGEFGRFEVDNWEPGERRKFKVKVPERRIPKPGTYILRVRIVEWIPQGTMYEETTKQLREHGFSGQKIKEVLKQSEEFWQEVGVDPHKYSPGSFSGTQIFDGRIVEYFRIEQFSTLWSFLGVSFALLTSLASLVVSIITLAKGK